MWPDLCRRVLMSMRKFILVSIFTFLSGVTHASEVLIQGTIPEWTGRQGIAIFSEDEYTLQPVRAGQFEADESGRFELRVEAGYTRILILRCGYVNLRFFIQPGRTYAIRLSDGERPMRSLVPTVYTYPVFDALSSDDPNARIGWFNEQYDAFFAENAWLIAQSEYAPGTGFRRSKSEKLKEFGLSEVQDSSLLRSEKAFGELALEFTRSMNEISAAWDDSFCRTYCLSVCAELLLSAGIKPAYVLGEVMRDCQSDLHNPGYTQFVSRCFTSPDGLLLSDTLWSVRQWVQQGKDASELLLRMESYIPGIRKSMACDVLFFSVFALRGKAGFDPGYLRQMAEDWDALSGKGELKTLLSRIEENEAKLDSGREFPDIALVKSDQSRSSISDHRGQLVCLAFFATWNAQSREELAFLDGIAKKYRRDLKVVAISLDEQFEDFRSFVASNHKYQMDFRYGFADYFLREETGVWSVPHFTIISPEGRILKGQAILPSRGLEEQLARAIGARPEERLKVWDD